MAATLWQIEPLGPWHRPVTSPRRSSGVFRAGWDATLRLLIDEAVHLGIKGAIALRVDVQDGDVRRDGMLRARATVGFPGVVVSFQSKHGPVSFATDAYEQVYAGDLPGWQANVRAVALSLQALRAVDRYGVTRSGEQYVGWKAISNGDAMSVPEARQFLLRVARDSGTTVELVDGDWPWPKVWRLARGQAHPDRNNGERAVWDRVGQAAAVLGLAEVVTSRG
jgi:hypothetical protein